MRAASKYFASGNRTATATLVGGRMEITWSPSDPPDDLLGAESFGEWRDRLALEWSQERGGTGTVET